MMKQLIRYIKGYVKISISGNETERFLNICAANNFELWNLDTSNCLFLFINDFKRIKPIAYKTKTKIHIQKKYGLPFIMQKGMKRKTFCIGVLFFFLVLYLLSLRIWNIHIEGNIQYSTQTILQYLKEKDISHGILKSELDCNKISAVLREQFSDIAWVSAKIKGTRLFLDIKEGVYDNQDKNTDQIPSNMTASKTGTIVSMITRKGVPLVSVGENVKKGDILISGTIPIKNDADEIVNYEYVPADGEVIINTNYSYYHSFELNYKKRIYKSDNYSRYFIDLFHYRIEFGLPAKKIIHYDQTTKTIPIMLTENFQLPFNIGIINRYPYQILELKYSEEEAIHIANHHLYLFLKNLSQKGVEIYKKDVKINTSETTCVTRGRIWVKEKMTEKVPLNHNVTNERISDT